MSHILKGLSKRNTHIPHIVLYDEEKWQKMCSNAYFGGFTGGGHFWRVTHIGYIFATCRVCIFMVHLIGTTFLWLNEYVCVNIFNSRLSMKLSMDQRLSSQEKHIIIGLYEGMPCVSFEFNHVPQEALLVYILEADYISDKWIAGIPIWWRVPPRPESAGPGAGAWGSGAGQMRAGRRAVRAGRRVGEGRAPGSEGRAPGRWGPGAG